MRSGAAAALGAALLAAAGGCCTCTRSTPYTVSRGTAGAAPSRPAPALRVLHFGDFGDATCQRDAVAAAMASAGQRAPLDLALWAGDNIYPCGLDPAIPGAEGCTFAADGNSVSPGYTPPADPAFDAAVEKPLAPLLRDARPVPVYLALGNHDVAAAGSCGAAGLSEAALSRRRACLEVAHRSPRWILPGRHYTFDAGPARFIVIDSNLLLGDYGGFAFEGEVEAVRAAAAGCGERPCFLVAHHNPATAGVHAADETPEVLARIARIEEAASGRIAAWLGGHDHDLQHLRTASGYDVLISGNASRGRPSERFEQPAPSSAALIFASTAWGFGLLEMASDRSWSYRFENEKGEPLHCCAAAPGGRCEPVACPR